MRERKREKDRGARRATIRRERHQGSGHMPDDLKASQMIIRRRSVKLTMK